MVTGKSAAHDDQRADFTAGMTTGCGGIDRRQGVRRGRLSFVC